jgi:hypothetical protein
LVSSDDYCVIACDKREAFAQGSEATSNPFLWGAWIASAALATTD